MPSDWSAALAATITTHRRRNGLSQGALASEAQIPKSAVVALEEGRYQPSMRAMENLAIALAIPVGRLLEGAGEGGDAPGVDPHVERLGHYPEGLAWEFWRLRLPPHDAMQGPPAAPGSVRLLHITTGVLHAGPEEAQETLSTGESKEFASDERHVYSTGDEGADVFIALGRPVPRP